MALPAGIAYDRLRPWPGEEEAIARYSRGQPLCVGYGALRVARRSEAGLVGHSYLQRVILLVPDVVWTPRALVLTRDDEGSVGVEPSAPALWVAAGFYAACGWGVVALRRRGAIAPELNVPRPAPPARTA